MLLSVLSHLPILNVFTKSLPVWDTTESSPAFCTELLRSKPDGIFIQTGICLYPEWCSDETGMFNFST
jgi:hypothetical protein